MRPVQLVRVLGLPAVLGALLGLAGGWLWWRWWGPPVDGKVYDTVEGPRWYPDPFDPGITRDFSGTGTYVVLAVGLGLVLGLACGWICRNRALLGLVAVGVASIGASVVMVLLGQAQSPADPQDRVDDVEIGTTLPDNLEVAWAPVDLSTGVAELLNDDDGVLYLPTAHLAWPAAALGGYLILLLALPLETRRPEQVLAERSQPVTDGSAPPPPA